jgi:hypothetical protein
MSGAIILLESSSDVVVIVYAKAELISPQYQKAFVFSHIRIKNFLGL